MKKRTSNIGIIYLRRSNNKNELSLESQFDWANGEATHRGIKIDATKADLRYAISNGLSKYKGLRLDDGISGADMTRPGFQAVLRDVEADRSISHVLVFRRDRLARPEDAMKMASIECNIRAEGVTFILGNGVAEPLDPSQPELAEQIKLLVEYYFNGEDLRKLSERVIDAQLLLAADGFSTGGDPPYGHVRVLVNAAGNVIETLPTGRRVRQPGCHVRWKAADQDKIMVWILILDLKHKGWGAKRIARYLNNLGIPSPGAGRMRKDHGIKHRVSGKWCARTILELCSNAAILAIKEYGNRSEGWHRRLGADGHRTLTSADRNDKKRPKIVRNDASLIIRKPTGEAPLYDAAKWNEIQRVTAERGKKQRGVPRAHDSSKYPLACRVVDITDGCGSVMYGRTVGKRRVYSCGRYMRTAGAECDNNQVDAEALFRLTALTLRQQINQLGQQDQIRRQLEELAKAKDAVCPAASRDHEIGALTQTQAQLVVDHDTIGRRMATEQDDERYRVIAAEFDRTVNELRDTEQKLAELKSQVVPDRSAAEEVEAAMAVIANIVAVAEDPNARTEFRSIVEQLRLWIGLEFVSAIKGKKRHVRRLRGGIFAFGDENLPIPVHGRDRVEQ